MGEINWGELLFTFHGRINRAKYWIGTSIYFLIGAAILLMTQLIDGPVAHGVGVIANIVVTISSLAVGAKRLHDRNRSAAWLVAMYGLPALLGTAAAGLAVYAFMIGVDVATLKIATALVVVAL